MIELHDNSFMPYGQHKGKLMGQVPAKDLIWLYEHGKAFSGVDVYVKANLDILRLQAANDSKNIR